MMALCAQQAFLLLAPSPAFPLHCLYATVSWVSEEAGWLGNCWAGLGGAGVHEVI